MLAKNKKLILSFGMSGNTLKLSFPYAASNVVEINDSVTVPIDSLRPPTIMVPTKSIDYILRHLKMCNVDYELEKDPGKNACNYTVWQYGIKALEHPNKIARRYFFHVSRSNYDSAYMQSIVRFVRSFHK
jgi:hypothetical protein